MVIINIMGGSGVGKTETSMFLMTLLNKIKANHFFVPETAKRLILTDEIDKLNDQYSVSREQYIMLKKLDQVDNILNCDKKNYVVFENSLLISLFYNFYNEKNINNKNSNEVIFKKWFTEFENMVFFLKRNKKYNYSTVGRFESLENAKIIDKLMLKCVKQLHDIIIIPSNLNSKKKAYLILIHLYCLLNDNEKKKAKEKILKFINKIKNNMVKNYFSNMVCMRNIK
jgi:hypothetical protein